MLQYSFLCVSVSIQCPVCAVISQRGCYLFWCLGVSAQASVTHHSGLTCFLAAYYDSSEGLCRPHVVWMSFSTQTEHEHDKKKNILHADFITKYVTSQTAPQQRESWERWEGGWRWQVCQEWGCEPRIVRLTHAKLFGMVTLHTLNISIHVRVLTLLSCPVNQSSSFNSGTAACVVDLIDKWRTG